MGFVCLWVLCVGAPPGAHATDATRDEGVDSSTQPLVTGEGNDEGVVGDVFECGFLHVNGVPCESGSPLVKGAGRPEAVFVTLQLGGGHHLHRGCDLHDVLGGGDLLEELLLSGHAAHLAKGREGRGRCPVGAHSPSEDSGEIKGYVAVSAWDLGVMGQGRVMGAPKNL